MGKVNPHKIKTMILQLRSKKMNLVAEYARRLRETNEEIRENLYPDMAEVKKKEKEEKKAKEEKAAMTALDKTSDSDWKSRLEARKKSVKDRKKDAQNRFTNATGGGNFKGR